MKVLPTGEHDDRAWTRFIGPAILLFAAFVAILPQILQGNSCGHDFDFHLVSWLDAQQSWRQGILYPHWSPSANFGAGEPRFIFYPPLSWMLGAALGFVMRWKAVPIAITYLCLAGTGLATRALARQGMSEGPATLAGCAAFFSGYALFTAYERSDFGELMGGFWIPLLLLLILRDRSPHAPALRRAFDGSAAPLALVLAGAWLSNPPLGVMASYLLAAVALLLAVLRRSGLRCCAPPSPPPSAWASPPFTSSPPPVSSAGSTFARPPTIPAMRSRTTGSSRVTPILLSNSTTSNCSRLPPSPSPCSPWPSPASGVLGGRHRFRGNARWWIPLALIPAGILFLQFPLSDPLWNLLPKLRFLQFPWRWLVVLEAPMGIFFASAIWIAHRRWRMLVLFVSIAAFTTATLFAGFSFFQVCDEDDAVAGMLSVYHAGTGFEGTDEYAPPGADNSLLPIGLPEACLTPSPSAALGQGAADSPPGMEPRSAQLRQHISRRPLSRQISRRTSARRRQPRP